MSGLPSFSTACHGEFGLWFPLQLLQQHKAASSLWISPSANPPTGVVSLQSSMLLSEGMSALPHNLAFLGCGVTHRSSNHLRLNEKGQGYFWFWADLSVGEDMEAAFPVVASTACRVLERSPLCSLWISELVPWASVLPIQAEEGRIANVSLSSLRRP